MQVNPGLIQGCKTFHEELHVRPRKVGGLVRLPCCSKESGYTCCVYGLLGQMLLRGPWLDSEEDARTHSWISDRQPGLQSSLNISACNQDCGPLA
jgi:hypothetical protein